VWENPEEAGRRGRSAADEVASRYRWEQVADRVRRRVLELA
jgi:hypothetical protein